MTVRANHQLSMTVLMTPPVAVPPWVPTTPDEIRRHHAAQIRKDMRREMEQRHAALHRVA